MIKQIHLNSCDSTQDILKEQLKGHDSIETILVSCENQLAGRGRGDNQWTSMPGTLCLSINIKPHIEPSFTAIEVSLIVSKFFEDIGKELKLKWPNDIWNRHDQKCCGVLVQSLGHQMMVGIGLNLFSSDPIYGAVFDDEFEFDKKSWSRELAEYILANRYEDTQKLKEDWSERCFHINKEVTITENAEVYQGTFLGIGVHGEAILRTSQDELRLYNGTLRLN